MRLGIDVGGSKIEGALVNDKGIIVDKLRHDTEASKGRKTVLNNILFVAKTLNNDDVTSIGLGLPGAIDNSGNLVFSTNLPFLNGMNVAKFLENELKKKVKQENDANCFVWAERRFGAAKGHRNVVGVIYGTGIGAGIVINGEIYRGTIGAAGEIGYTIIANNKSFEELCAGPGIVKRYNEEQGRIENPTAKKIFESKESVARRIVDETYKYLGMGFANVITTLNPEIIVVGGGISNQPIYRRLMLEVGKHVNPALIKHISIVQNKLGDSSGVIGAAFL
ncbi:MAG: ROK family protein [archaeon]